MLRHEQFHPARRIAPINHRTVRAQVADATRSAHDALHVHPVLTRLLASDITVEEYQMILCRYLAFYEAAEVCCARSDLMPALTLQSEVEMLCKDVPERHKSFAVQLPVTSKAQTLGMLYVLLGSRFGANVIHRHLRKALPNHRHHFFGGQNFPDRWQMTLKEMEARQCDPAFIADLIRGAETTFVSFDSFMLGKRTNSLLVSGPNA